MSICGLKTHMLAVLLYHEGGGFVFADGADDVAFLCILFAKILIELLIKFLGSGLSGRRRHAVSRALISQCYLIKVDITRCVFCIRIYILVYTLYEASNWNWRQKRSFDLIHNQGRCTAKYCAIDCILLHKTVGVMK